MKHSSIGLVLPLAVLLTAPGALAQNKDSVAAEALFQEGRQLLEEGKAAEACPKLAESHRLDPATGTLMALALCHEQEGKLASAWAEFTEVEGRARSEGRKDRVQLARKRAAALKPRLSTLTIHVSPEASQASGLAISRDAVELGKGSWNAAVPIDGGEHTIEVTAPGKQTQKLSVTVKPEGDQAELSVGPLIDEPTKPAEPLKPLVPPPAAAPPEKHGLAPLQWAGIGTGAAGVIALGVGGVFLAGALGKKSDSDSDCTGDVCGPAGQKARSDAVDKGNMATIFGIAGGVLVAGGVTLYFVGRPKAQKEEPVGQLSISFAGAPGGAAARLMGTF